MDNFEHQHNVITEAASQAHSALLNDTPFGSHSFAPASGKPDSVVESKDIAACISEPNKARKSNQP